VVTGVEAINEEEDDTDLDQRGKSGSEEREKMEKKIEAK
jgi:hypothetical protein